MMNKLWTMGIVVAAMVGGCGSSGPSEADLVFLEGRELIGIFELIGPDTSGDDGTFRPEEVPTDEAYIQLLLLAEAFDVQLKHAGNRDEWDTFPSFVDDFSTGEITDHRNSHTFQIIARDGFDQTRGVAIDSQSQEYGFGVDLGLDAPNLKQGEDCGFCDPITITGDQAIAEAKRMLKIIGFDPTHFAFEVQRAAYETVEEPVNGEPARELRVRAMLLLEGVPTGQVTKFYYGHGDTLVRVQGRVRFPIQAGEVGLLTPEEALLAYDATNGGNLVNLALEGSRLGWDSQFDRASLRSYVIPVYWLTLTDDLQIKVPAVRLQDLNFG